MREVVG